jgi:integration host factor subunit beta
MKKNQLIEKITRRQQSLSQHDVELSVKHILSYLANALASQGRIEIRGFGNFSLHYQEKRIVHNPRTGEKAHVPGKYKVRFKVGKELGQRLAQKKSSS